MGALLQPMERAFPGKMIQGTFAAFRRPSRAAGRAHALGGVRADRRRVA